MVVVDVDDDDYVDNDVGLNKGVPTYWLEPVTSCLKVRCSTN